MTFGLVTASHLAIGEQTTISSQPAPQRSYRLFVGLDVQVGQDGQYGVIEGYVNNRVHTDTSEGLVSLRNIDDVRFIRKPKLSRNSLTIENINTEEIAGNRHAARDAMRNQQALEAYRDSEIGALQAEIRSAEQPEIGENGGPVVDQAAKSNAASIGAQSELADFESLTTNMLNDSVYIDAEGRVTGLDPNPVVPEAVVDLVTELPFLPGLEDGVAVTSTVQVNLAPFFR